MKLILETCLYVWDYQPNDIRPLNINLVVVSRNIKLSISIIYNEYNCANNSRKFAIPAALKPTTSAYRHRPIPPLRGRYVCPCYARRYLPAAISNNFLFVKISVDYIITQ